MKSQAIISINSKTWYFVFVWLCCHFAYSERK